jgi:glycosyltransferase involved in cell wall biosynthesis
MPAPPVLRCGPKISVLIPSYNHAAYISEAIGSVLLQDWPDLELLVLDDGSTDDTVEAAERAVKGERRIRCSVST